MSKVKFYHLWGKVKAKDGKDHYVTVVGKLVQTRKKENITEIVPIEFKPGHFVNGELKYSIKKLNRKLTLGIAICHPMDDFDEEVGCEIAKARIEKGQDAGTIETSDVTMLTEDAIMAELLTKLQYVTNNINDFLS
jgi:hypothetical protein